MNCPRCQHENQPGAKFCQECSAPLARACSNCSTQLPEGAKFCPECAYPVSSSPSKLQRFGSPDSYTPKHLADRILTSKSALEGERKQITVLFADLKGSMELLADRDPEEARKLLDPVLEKMMEAVHRYEGTVNQVMGDGVMALFGAPIAHEDHAVRACYAALRMQESVKQYAQGVRRAEAVSVQIRVGLNSGEVVVRAIGSDLRMDYTAVGQTTHLAARMEQLATPGSILLTADTLRLAEGYVRVTSIGPVNVKGLVAPVEVFELKGAGTARTRLQAAVLRGLTRFVGRDAEVEHLRRVLDQAGEGHGQVVAIVGEAGVGKSRLVYEFTHSHRVQRWLVLEAPSVSYGRATSYLPVIDLLKGYFKIGDRDDHREMRDKVLGRVLGLDRALETLLAPLMALLDVPVEDAVWISLDPPQRRQRILDAVKRLLLRESQVQPLLLVFEDLHWVDGESQALLDNLVDGLGSARLLLLVNYRPEYEHRWGSKTAYSQLRLDALPAESTVELLQALLGPDPGLAPLTKILVKRGNPFFLEETVRSLVETGALVGERGAYRLTRPIETLQPPTTVQAILAARIDRLRAEEKQLLQAASVIGKDIPYALLAAIAEQPEEELRRHLTALQSAEFLYETSLLPELKYTFKHALTHEVAYQGLLAERRRALHTAIVNAIESLFSDNLAEQIERLAHHALRGEVWGKALQYLAQAGARAAGRSANREAAVWFEQALETARQLPQDVRTVETAIDLRLELRPVLLNLGAFERMSDHLREAERLAQALGDRRRLAWVLTAWTIYRGWLGDTEEALRCAQQACSLGEELADLGIQVVAANYLGWVYQVKGEYRKATNLFGYSVGRLSGDAVRERFGQTAFPAVYARSYLAWALAELGAFADALASGEEGLAIAEGYGQPFSIVMASLALGFVHLLRDNHRTAIPVLERALHLCRAFGIVFWLPPVASSLGRCHLLAGRLADALPLLEEAVQAAKSIGLVYGDVPLSQWLSEARLAAGGAVAALPLAIEALDHARTRRYRGQEGWTLRLLGDIAAQDGAANVERSEASYRQAIALAEELEMRPLQAHCHLELGTLLARISRSEEARGQLSIAASMLREMDMQSWFEKAESVLEHL